MTEPRTAQILVDTPPGFVRLPLPSEEERGTERITALAGQIAQHDGYSAEQMSRYLGLVGTALYDNNVRLFGKFVVGTDEPAVATLTLVLGGLTEPDSEDAERIRSYPAKAADALLARYRERRPDSDAQVVRLPIGPAVAAATAGEYRLPPEMTGQHEEIVRPVFRAEFQVLAPDGARLIILSVNTNSEAGWPDVARTALEVASSIRYEPGDT
ncbi:MAG: hypothetical protein GEU98_06975 [Pseudonocardiaceae bacterium]|nr:hypothetical protein [Pseudonocardiaceae bacterium]